MTDDGRVLRASRFASALLVVVCGREAVADPPTAGTHVTWRILENHGPDTAPFATRLEVVARASDGTTQRVGPFDLPCYVSTDNGVLTCTYGGAFDYLRVRRAGGVCVVEGQRSTEHGMGPRRTLGRFRCRAPLVESVETVAHR